MGSAYTCPTCGSSLRVSNEHKYCAEKPRNGPLYPYDEEAFPVPGEPLYDDCEDFSIAYEFVEVFDDE